MAIVCHCWVVRDATIIELIEQGAASVAEIGEQCQAGTDCAGCHETLTNLLNKFGRKTTDTVATT